jgi:hypothetical protein
MKYYKLFYDCENSDDAVLLEIDKKLLVFDIYDVEKRKIELDEWTDDMQASFDIANGHRITDYLVNNLDWFIVTDKLKRVIESMGNDGIQFLPIRAVSKDGSQVTDAYVVNIFNHVDAIDLENSVYDVFPVDENTNWISVVKYALKRNTVKYMDLFRLKDHFFPIFISERLKKAMEENEITGCAYMEVKVVDNDSISDDKLVKSKGDQSGKNTSDNDLDKFLQAEKASLEKLLGQMHALVSWAIIGFEMGGPVNIYRFPNTPYGTAFVTMELIEPDGSGPVPNRTGTYELIAFTKHPIETTDGPSSPFNRIESRIRKIFTRIANHSYDTRLDPGDTCDIPPDDSDEGFCLVLDEFKSEGNEFVINGRKHGLLLVIEVFRSEMEYAMEKGSNRLLDLLKEKGHYPYSDLDREPVV